jgi:hypothetical protein
MSPDRRGEEPPGARSAIVGHSCGPRPQARGVHREPFNRGRIPLRQPAVCGRPAASFSCTAGLGALHLPKHSLETTLRKRLYSDEFSEGQRWRSAMPGSRPRTNTPRSNSTPCTPRAAPRCLSSRPPAPSAIARSCRRPWTMPAQRYPGGLEARPPGAVADAAHRDDRAPGGTGDRVPLPHRGHRDHHGRGPVGVPHLRKSGRV